MLRTSRMSRRKVGSGMIIMPMMPDDARREDDVGVALAEVAEVAAEQGVEE